MSTCNPHVAPITILGGQGRPRGCWTERREGRTWGSWGRILQLKCTWPTWSTWIPWNSGKPERRPPRPPQVSCRCLYTVGLGSSVKGHIMLGCIP